MGAQGTRNAAGGCPVVLDPRNGATPETMSAATLGPDGNLYIGWMRDGVIERIPHPATFDPSNDADCARIEVPIFAADARLGNGGAAGHTFGLAWIGHTLFGADNISPWFKDNADQCLTPTNGNQRCGPPSRGYRYRNPGRLCSWSTGWPGLRFYLQWPQHCLSWQYTVCIDPGRNGEGYQRHRRQNMGVTPQFGGTFCFITGVSIDTTNLANETVFIGSDCTQGTINGAGAIWKVKSPASGWRSAGSSIECSSRQCHAWGRRCSGTALVSWIPAPTARLLPVSSSKPYLPLMALAFFLIRPTPAPASISQLTRVPTAFLRTPLRLPACPWASQYNSWSRLRIVRHQPVFHCQRCF